MRISLSILGISFLLFVLQSCGTSTVNSEDIDSEKYYQIISVSSGKCLDVENKDEGAKIFQCTCNNSDKQKFKFIEDVNDYGFYFIMNKFSNKYIDIAAGSKDDGGQVIQWTPNNGENQKFSLIALSDDKYNLVSKNSGKLIDVPSANKKDSIFLIQWGANGQENQTFYLNTEE